MKRLLVSLVTLCLLVGGAGLTATGEAEASSGTTKFGMDAKSISSQANAGVKPDYGVIWIGPWTLSTGWGDPNWQMSNMRSQGVTPVIHFYYWGDDISQNCVSNGCWSSLHNTWKDQAGWQRLAQQLVDNVKAKMGNDRVVIVLETEFNKADMQWYSPFDRQLKDKANHFKWNLPDAKVVLGLGNWNRDAWGTWSGAAAASDYIGLQAMRGSTKDSLSEYRNVYDETLLGVKHARSLYGKPVFITDIALSSYWEPDYVKHQAENLKKFFTNIGTLKSNGVKAMLYRTWEDQPDKNTANYYGEAERHWGLAYSWGKWKPAANVWVDGVKQERSGSTSSTSTSSGSYSASFAPSSGVNEWWIDVKVKSSPDPSSVHTRIDGGSWKKLDATSWGTWAKSLHAPSGSKVQFRATAPDGTMAYSGIYTWLKSSSTSTSSSDFSPSFHLSSGVNEWWIDVKVKSSPDPSSVHTRIDGGSWKKLDATSWGTWAKSLHAPSGSKVQFRATAPDGTMAYSGIYTWLKSSTSSSFSATFSPKNQGNDWWVETGVKSSSSVSGVKACLDGGSCTSLPKTSWGTWAKSIHAPDGTKLQFVATSSSGQKAYSGWYTW